MATLTLTLGASADDAKLDDSGYDDLGTFIILGTPGAAATPANSGYGYRFLNVTLAATDTINSAILKLMKIVTEFSVQSNRWTCADEDNTATFSSGSAPGSRAIVATIIADSNNVSETDGTVYNFPRTAGNQVSYGAAIANVTGRAGWASGNAIAIINQSKQDAGQGSGFARKTWHTYDSLTASSEPQLTIDYTAAAAAASVDKNTVRQGRQTGIGGGLGQRR